MKRIIKAIVAVCLSAVTCIAVSACGGKKADTAVPPDENGSYSIITKLDLKVEFDGDAAAAKVKNTFTLFPATARVQAYLYYSETETNSYAEMTEVATEYIEDLNLGKTLTASWDTKGRGGYFRARMRYKIDNREWEERVTGQYLRDYTKPVLEPIPDDGSLPVFEDVEPVLPAVPLNSGYESIYTNLFFYLGQPFPESEICDKVGDKKFYIFNPKEKDYLALANHISYGVYRQYSKYVLIKGMLLDIPKFGYANPIDTERPTGLGKWNISLSFRFNNVEALDLVGKLKIVFGKLYDKQSFYKEFFNIYVGNSSIGVCYFKLDTDKKVSYAFFHNLLAEGLSIL